MSAVSPEPDAVPTAADPRALRAGLPPALVGDFDREWDLVLETAKRDKDLTPIHSMLLKWRHVLHAERAEPGVTRRLAEKARGIERTGWNPDAVDIDAVREVIDRRSGR